MLTNQDALALDPENVPEEWVTIFAIDTSYHPTGAIAQRYIRALRPTTAVKNFTIRVQVSNDGIVWLDTHGRWPEEWKSNLD